MKPVRIEISLKTLFTILFVCGALYVVSQIRDILVLLMISFVFMTALQPLIESFQRLKVSRIVAILFIYLLIVAFLILAVAFLIPPLVDQTAKLLVQLDVTNLPLLKELHQFTLTTDQITALLSQYGSSVGTVVTFITSAFSIMFSIFTVLVMSLYLLLERNHLYRYAAFLFRTKDRELRSRRLFLDIETGLGGWVRGEFALMVTIGVMTYIGLTLLGIPYALPLSILAGFLEALPNLGPTIAAVPAVIVAWAAGSPLIAGITVLLYLLIQALENNLIVPQVMKNAVGISPMTSIILILVGVRFGGVMGALLIIPTYIVVRIIMREFTPEIKNILQGKEE